jgi:hypothetical protein
MQITIHVQVELTIAIATGSFTLENAKKTFVELLEAVKTHNPKRVLFDARQLTGWPTDIERYQYAEFCAREVNKLSIQDLPTPRFAYLMEVPILDHGRYGETVAINRGMDVKATDSHEEAMEWLGITF